jgi:outer membrane biosynthesis protein TonB
MTRTPTMARNSDEPRTPMAVSLAVGLHVLAALLLAWSFWVARKPVAAASEHVFDLVTAPSDSKVDAPAAQAAPAAQTPTIHPLHLPTPAKFTPIPPIPKTPPTPPTPPTPTTPAPTPPQPTTTAPATMTIDQFRQKFGQPATAKPTKPTTPARTVPQVGLSASAEEQALQAMANSATGTQSTEGRASSTQVSDYFSKLIARLQAAYEGPPQLVDPGLVAGFEMSIAADGRVLSWRLTQSSGNPVFDEAVKATLARVTAVDPPPNGAFVWNSKFHNIAK